MRLILATFVLVASCSAEPTEQEDARLHVVASFYPAAELARAVGGEHVRVTELTPASAEPHDLEPDNEDVEAIEDADVVVYLGGGFQPAVERAVRRADGRRVDMRAGVEGDDPHVWLDLELMGAAARGLADALIAEDAAHADDYRRRLDVFQSELSVLDEQYRTTLRTCARRTFVTTHTAFGRLAERYGLRLESLTGTSPEAEPDPRRQAQLLDLIRRQGITTVFTEGPNDHVGEALAREAGVRHLPLPTIERPTVANYVNAMQGNLLLLGEALECTG